MRGPSMWSMIALSACSGPEGSGDDTTVPTVPTPAPVTGGGEVTLETRDGVTLVGDLYPGQPGAPGFVLLHMIPPAWDRTSWPASFVDRLVDRGWWVLALDRRGAGESGGVASEAYEGEKGRYDLEAAAVLLRDRGAGPLAVVGASNGTTTLLDYAVFAGPEGLPPVAAAGFMTGGTYTETNNPFGSMPAVPSIFTYSTAERAWSVAQQSLDPGTWSFLEYPDGDHGTKMFDAAPEVGSDLEAFFANALPEQGD